MKKRVIGLVLGFVLLFSMFYISFVSAAIEDFDNCEDYCNDFWSAAMPACPGDYIVDGIYPDCTCEWYCYEGEGTIEDPEDDVDVSGLEGCRDDCKLTYDNEEDRSKCISGCKSDFGFIDPDDDYRCEDMTQSDCELADACESVFESTECVGDTCTMGMIWKGCRYQYEETFDELDKEYEDEEINPGLTPDSVFYFLDGLIESREEKIAEVKVMIEQGDYESARKALLKYMEQAKKFEDDPDPEKREEARKAAAAIHRMLQEIKQEVSEDQREEFYDNVLDTEGEIVTAVEISNKIKELCEQLAEVDPLEYDKMCRAGDNAPKWQKRLHEDLSAEQEKTAKEFVNIMKNCFKTSGQNCRCDDIPFYDFSIACSKAAPLATACDIEGDEIACDELDNLDMPELPDWLQPIWMELESGMMEAQYDMHMPPECIEAGAKTPKECGKIMIKEHSPLECRVALLESNCDGEMECRKICDKIMFELHSPQECIDKGITDPRECGEFMDQYRGPRDEHFGPGSGPDCMSIEDPMERLDCYDNKGNEFDDHYGPMDGENQGEITWQCKENRIHWGPDCETFMREEWPEHEKRMREEGDMRREQQGDWRIKEKECANSCGEKAWDFRNGKCECYDYGGDYRGDDENYDGRGGCGDCASKCPGASRTDCINDRCECYYDGDEYNEPQHEDRRDDYDNRHEGEGYDYPSEGEPERDEGNTGYVPPEDKSSYTPDNEAIPGPADDGPSEPESSPEPAPEPEPAPATGEVIRSIHGNAFLDYYWN